LINKPLYPSDYLQILKRFYKKSQEQIAKELGISVTTVSKAMNGSSSVNIETFAEIVQSLNCDLEIRINPRDPEFAEHIKKLIPMDGAQTTA
jgi:transcriptional regulator with XRE-family HTH domain